MAEDDFNQNDDKTSPVKIIALVAVLVVIAIGAYFVSKSVSSHDAGVAPLAASEQTLEEATDETTAGADSAAPDSTASAAAPSVDVQKALSVRGIGNPEAPVKLKEFFSLTCNHCANFHNITLPQIKQYIDNGQVYLEFHEFPLNAPALRASMVARCLPDDKYYGFISVLFKTQDAWTRNPDYMGALRQNAKLAGMSDAEFDACVSNNELQNAIGEQIQEATARWHVESTPTFVVNNGAEIIKGAQPAYEFERVFRAVTNGEVAPLMKDQQAATE